MPDSPYLLTTMNPFFITFSSWISMFSKGSTNKSPKAITGLLYLCHCFPFSTLIPLLPNDTEPPKVHLFCPLQCDGAKVIKVTKHQRALLRQSYFAIGNLLHIHIMYVHLGTPGAEPYQYPVHTPSPPPRISCKVSQRV